MSETRNSTLFVPLNRAAAAQDFNDEETEGHPYLQFEHPNSGDVE